MLSENGNPAPVFNIKTQGVFGVDLPEKTINAANIDNDNKDQGNVMGGGINGGINND